MKKIVHTILNIYTKYFKEQSTSKKIIFIFIIFIAISPLVYRLEVYLTHQDGQLRQNIFLSTLKKNSHIQEIVKIENEQSDYFINAENHFTLLIPQTIYYAITIKTREGYLIDLQQVNLKSIFAADTITMLPFFEYPEFYLKNIYSQDNPNESYNFIVTGRNWSGKLGTREEIEEVLGVKIRGIGDFLDHYTELIALYKKVEASSDPYTITTKDKHGRIRVLTLERNLK